MNLPTSGYVAYYNHSFCCIGLFFTSLTTISNESLSFHFSQRNELHNKCQRDNEHTTFNMANVPKRPRYAKRNGLLYPEMFSPKCFQEAMEYKPKPGDVFIDTYPKCGTTWMQNVAMYIFRKGKGLEDPSEFLKFAPFIDMLGIEGINNMPRPGAFKTHLPYTYMPYSLMLNISSCLEIQKIVASRFTTMLEMNPGLDTGMGNLKTSLSYSWLENWNITTILIIC
ncbi:sulfotransferase 1C2A [Caerostris extrusa]|uniref:Sulfotransferase 1C2A n=1 Tax=Caerostris extrusa TaxID=172846 RepID=A0AAV4UYI3_CAEEX|nr:sulfotransferase 1C2A [Caerostris extrusa]